MATSDVRPTAVILAGGQGVRLSTVVADRPKPMADVAGQPFLTRLLTRLAAEGVSHCIVCTGYMAPYIRAHLGDGSQWCMRVEYSFETEPLGTGGALRHALPLFDSDPVLVLNGDSWCDFDVRTFEKEHSSSGFEGSLVVVNVDDRRTYGGVVLDTDDRILSFEEKRPEIGPGWISAGVYLLSKALIASAPVTIPLSIERDLFPAWTKAGLHGFRVPGAFIDIGSPESYRAAHALFQAIEPPQKELT